VPGGIDPELGLAVSVVASADSLIGFTTTIPATDTDITDFTALLPAWNPGGPNTTASNVAGGTLGVTMASLNKPGLSYKLVGYNITVDETLTGNYSVTNTSTNSPFKGSVFIDSYTAVALDGTLAPALTTDTDPVNDLFGDANTLIPSVGNGEQPLSNGGGPDPNAPPGRKLTLAPNGGTFNSGNFNSSSGWVDLGCEVQNKQASSPGFCSDGLTAGDIAGGFSHLMLPTTLPTVSVFGPPNLDFDFSTATETDTNGTGGNLESSFHTKVAEQVTVYYDYVSFTPEPGTLALMGGALMAFGLLGKRLSKR
jgi:hypothetical protein